MPIYKIYQPASRYEVASSPSLRIAKQIAAVLTNDSWLYPTVVEVDNWFPAWFPVLEIEEHGTAKMGNDMLQARFEFGKEVQLP